MRDSPYQPTTTTAAEEELRIALNTTVAASMAGKQAGIDVLLERVRKRDPGERKKLIGRFRFFNGYPLPVVESLPFTDLLASMQQPAGGKPRAKADTWERLPLGSLPES
jgi:hypothetical protein